MTFERSRDFELVRQIMTSPQNWAAGADDYAGAPEDFQPREDEGIVYALVHDSDELLGLFVLAEHSAVESEIHTRLLPNGYGTRATAAIRGVCAWYFGTTRCRRIVGAIPQTNRLAIRYAVRAGFRQYGFNPASYAKDGQLIAQVLYGISKGEL